MPTSVSYGLITTRQVVVDAVGKVMANPTNGVQVEPCVIIAPVHSSRDAHAGRARAEGSRAFP